MNYTRFVTTIAALLGLLVAGQAAALPSDREQPIHIQADSAELDERKGTAVYRGDVVITQGTLKITGDTVTVRQLPGGEIESFTSVGQPAYYEQKPDVDKELVQAYGITIEYFARDNRIVITDQAKVVQTDNTFRGEKITYHTINETIHAERAPAGSVTREEPRVQMVIQPRNKQDAQEQEQP